MFAPAGFAASLFMGEKPPFSFAICKRPDYDEEDSAGACHPANYVPGRPQVIGAVRRAKHLLKVAGIATSHTRALVCNMQASLAISLQTHDKHQPNQIYARVKS